MRNLLAILFLIPLLVKTQTTAIPDANFEQALINLGYDTGSPDGSVPTANISGVTSLSVGFLNISDLTGIEDFASLERLACGYNQISTLDLSQNTMLTDVYCGFNQITNLNVLGLSQLDSLSCFANLLTNIDVTQSPVLTYLGCNGNLLTSLDVTQNPLLERLGCYENLLNSLDVSQNPSLVYLGANNNQLTNINLSQNTQLNNLRLDSNALTILMLDQNPLLTFFHCGANQLTCLNLKNGGNTNIGSGNFFANYNPNLTCIEVNDVNHANANWWGVDVQTSFSTNCGNACSTVGIEKENEINVSFYPNPTTGNFTIDLGDIITNIKATLTNSLGQIIYTKNYTSTNLIELEIDGSAGLYFLQLETENSSQVIKILKE